MLNCGIQCMICDYPIHLDTYSGCSHNCSYCFANHKTKGTKPIKPLNNKWAVKRFIEGHRNSETRFCDWAIPIHWGANSDPFQPCEIEYKRTVECLEIFAQTKYPFIISTKNPVLAAKEPYLSLLKESRVVFQISMACGKHDKMETGAPTYEERLKAASILSKNVTRVIARVQPFFIEYYQDIINEIPRYAKAGIYGVIVEGYNTQKKAETVDGMERDGSKYGFPMDTLVPLFLKIKNVCHENGIRFFCGEDEIRWLGDDLTCCGTENLSDFLPNKFNIEHLAHDTENIQPSAAMSAEKTSRPFRSRRQSTEWERHIKDKSFAEMMYEMADEYVEWYQDIRKEMEEKYV